MNRIKRFNISFDELIMYSQSQQNYHKGETSDQTISYSSIQDFKKNYRPISSILKKEKILSMGMSMIKGSNGFYFGEVKKGKKNGLGVLIANNHSIYEGSWKEDQRCGNGYQKNNDGSCYSGNFVNNSPEGVGKHITKSGDYYEGQWFGGKKNGSGVWKSKKGQSYIGEWKNNQPQGFGVLIDKIGNKYEGLVKEGMKDGKGIEKLKNGDIYDGSYQSGFFHGYGEYYWANGSVYKGQFVKGVKEGPGIWKSHKEQSQYEGYFRANKKQGYGVFTWKTGGVYKGNFQDDVRSGYGEMFWPNGDIYRGRWAYGKQNGKGQLFIKIEGHHYSGIFRNNQLVVLINEQQIVKEQDSDNQSPQISKAKIDVDLPKIVPVETMNSSITKRVQKVSNKGRQIIQYANILLPMLRPRYNRIKTQMRQKKNIDGSALTKRGRDRKSHSVFGVHYSFGKNNPSNTDIDGQKNQQPISKTTKTSRFQTLTSIRNSKSVRK